MIASGAAVNYQELARRAGVTAERLSQVMKLIWLAPAIQDAGVWRQTPAYRTQCAPHCRAAVVAGEAETLDRVEAATQIQLTDCPSSRRNPENLVCRRSNSAPVETGVTHYFGRRKAICMRIPQGEPDWPAQSEKVVARACRHASDER